MSTSILMSAPTWGVHEKRFDDINVNVYDNTGYAITMQLNEVISYGFITSTILSWGYSLYFSNGSISAVSTHIIRAVVNEVEDRLMDYDHTVINVEMELLTPFIHDILKELSGVASALGDFASCTKIGDCTLYLKV